MSPLHVWIIATIYKGRGPSVVVFWVCEHGKAMEQTFVQICVCTFATFVLSMVCWNMTQDNLVGEI